MSDKGSVVTSERDQLSEIIFMFSSFTFATGAHSISEENSLCLLSLVIIVVHVILLDKILK